MAAPDIIDWVDVAGFRYSKSKRANLYQDVDIIEFLATLGDTVVDRTLLSQRSVYAISSKTDEIFAHWKSYDCLCAEIEDDGRVYILHNGKWYEVAKSFTDEIIKAFHETVESTITLPDYTHKDEGEYNRALPSAITDLSPTHFAWMQTPSSMAAAIVELNFVIC